MKNDLGYVIELLNNGNEITVTDIANILSCTIDDAKIHMESLFDLQKNKFIVYYIVNYTSNGTFVCKKIIHQSLNEYPNSNPFLYSIQLSKPNQLSNNIDKDTTLLNDLANAKSSGSVFIPKYCNITVADVATRQLSFLGSDIRKNTKSGTSFDLTINHKQKTIDVKKSPQITNNVNKSLNSFLKSEPNVSTLKFESNNSLKTENLSVKSADTDYNTTIKSCFSTLKKESASKFGKRDLSTMQSENKLNSEHVKSFKPAKCVNVNTHSEQNLFDEQSDYENENEEYMNTENAKDKFMDCDTNEPRKIIINEKISKQSTYVDNGYFVMEDCDEIIQVEKEVKLVSKPITNVVNFKSNNVDKKISQSSITSFFKVLKN